MNPHKLNKVDISSMSEEDQKAFKLYGKVPGKNVLTKMQKDRKYFDSGDYMMNKAGVQSAQAPGTAIPTPEGLPHAFSPSIGSPPPIASSSPPGSIPIPSNVTRESFSAQQGQGQQGNDRLSPSQGVGVGISPAATSEAMEVPGGGVKHVRRGSESHTRASPPTVLRENSNPSSSFPIHHSGVFGSSPVKTSNLGRMVDEES
ncbi:uncharacterized protein MKK02DRAFT_40929 [Dioszegia hungarica]|uniref:mRNA stability protein n=1 Tax=Dioszegia hungarica TaxID=4972 RepID=A0AA38LR57_9TREE|nr:uncharacterized protein MKK02DRAFT_40929 [Dioszegia hungarica]KAI9632625.1 hypothetical protein MKK02DRAFT_40929 [Dioszegia hungarica]